MHGRPSLQDCWPNHEWFIGSMPCMSEDLIGSLRTIFFFWVEQKEGINGISIEEDKTITNGFPWFGNQNLLSLVGTC